MDQLFGWLASLPAGPEWKSTEIEMKGLETTWDAHLI